MLYFNKYLLFFFRKSLFFTFIFINWINLISLPVRGHVASSLIQTLIQNICIYYNTYLIWAFKSVYIDYKKWTA